MKRNKHDEDLHATMASRLAVTALEDSKRWWLIALGWVRFAAMQGTCCENGRCMNSLGVVYIVAAIGCEWLMSMSGDVNVLADFGIRGLDWGGRLPSASHKGKMRQRQLWNEEVSGDERDIHRERDREKEAYMQRKDPA